MKWQSLLLVKAKIGTFLCHSFCYKVNINVVNEV